MSHITLSCKSSLKIDFSLDSDSKYHEISWPPKYIKINIFTNNFATTYARDINNMSILIFSGIRKPILSFVFRKKYCKVYILAVNIVFADRFFFCFDYAWLVPLW